MVSRKVAKDSRRAPMRYCLLKPSTLMIGFIGTQDYTTSANSLSIRRNQNAAQIRVRKVMTQETRSESQLKGRPNRAEREASMIPLTGLNIMTVRNFGGSALEG